MEWVQRQLFPPRALELADRLAPHAERLAGPLGALESAPWPDDLRLLRERLGQVTRQAIDLIGAFASAARSGEPIELYRALRRLAPLQEALYPLAPVLDPVSRWFLEPVRRDDDVLLRRLRDAALREDGARVGVLHARNDRGTRGGLSLYVPETWEASGPPAPLVVALHGGSGHGRDYLWAWLREARTRGVLLLSPTALDRTWSIMGGEDVDAPRLQAAVEDVAVRYHVDRSRVLLTGMSDGATYALLCGLRDAMPFTHLAPACGVLHPFLLARGDIQHARGTPDLSGPRRARLDVPRADRAHEPGRAPDGGGAGRLPGDRGPLAHLPAGREPARSRLAAGPGQLVGVAAAKRLMGSGVVTALRHAAAT